MNASRRSLLAAFLALPVAARFRPWVRPAAAELARLEVVTVGRDCQTLSEAFKLVRPRGIIFIPAGHCEIVDDPRPMAIWSRGV